MLSSGKVQRVLLGVLVALVAAIAVVVVARRVQGAPGSTTATVAADDTYFDGNLLPDVKAANFTLTDQYGHRVTLSRDRGHVVVLAWIHSLCKNDCPFIAWQIKGALHDLPDHGRSVRVIGVSVDPREDTRARRREFVAAHQLTGRMQYVNGSPAAMRPVWRAYGIQPVTPRADHSAFVYLVSRHGYERVGFPAVQLTSSGLAHDIRRLQNGR